MQYGGSGIVTVVGCFGRIRIAMSNSPLTCSGILW
jgi:hypothetical protein